MRDISHIRTYDFSPDDELFSDANVWLFILGPRQPRTDLKIEIYSSAYRRILEAKSRIYIDVLVASEFINTCVYLETGGLFSVLRAAK